MKNRLNQTFISALSGVAMMAATSCATIDSISNKPIAPLNKTTKSAAQEKTEDNLKSMKQSIRDIMTKTLMICLKQNNITSGIVDGKKSRIAYTVKNNELLIAMLNTENDTFTGFKNLGLDGDLDEVIIIYTDNQGQEQKTIMNEETIKSGQHQELTEKIYENYETITEILTTDCASRIKKTIEI